MCRRVAGAWAHDSAPRKRDIPYATTRHAGHPKAAPTSRDRAAKRFTPLPPRREKWLHPTSGRHLRGTPVCRRVGGCSNEHHAWALFHLCETGRGGSGQAPKAALAQANARDRATSETRPWVAGSTLMSAEAPSGGHQVAEPRRCPSAGVSRLFWLAGSIASARPSGTTAALPTAGVHWRLQVADCGA